jgi:long-chain acyl-CoA synthetase
MAELEPRYKTLVDVYEKSVSAYGSRPLFGTKTGAGWGWVTYGEFGALVESFRSGLASLGVARGDRVAIISNNRVPWAVAAYACYGLGAVFVPLYESQAPKEWEFIVRDCGAKLLIVATETVLARFRDLLSAIPALTRVVLIEGATSGDDRVTTYASVLASGAPSGVATIHPSLDDTATILYTSGTTATPKGVVLTHGNLASNVSGGQQVFPITPGDRSLSILPWAHAFGQVAELHTFFACGASMALCEGMDKILSNLAEVKPTLLACVPAIFNRVYTSVRQQLGGRPAAVRALVDRALRAKAKERAGTALRFPEAAVVRLVDAIVFAKVRARLGGKLRFAISGGAALSREVGQFIDAIGVVVFEGYGLTETSPVVTANAPSGRKLGSVGRPFPDVRVVIDPTSVDHSSDAAAKASRVDGEIIVYGPNVMKGYYNRPDETAAVFTADHGFRTGDMGYVDSDGYLFITGRIKEQYKLQNGKYVVPAALEEQIRLSPYVANAMVYGDNKPHNVALLVANVAAVRAWAAASHLALPGSVDEIVKDERVRALFAGEIKARSAEFKGFERIQGFVLVPGEFTVESGMLTPKMSLKRRRIVEVYGPLIEQMYARPKSES